jgi:ubiquinone/menaquinone biosynthesis C-methylase UbiE
LPLKTALTTPYGKYGVKTFRGSWVIYLKKKGPLTILDIGCGNGFFTNLMAREQNRVVGIDVNMLELEQAAAVFATPSIKWYYLDIMTEELPANTFDLITFCCSFQYFKDPELLLLRCNGLLKEKGEIHIIDSPFYNEDTKQTAKENTVNYYRAMKTESMTHYYYHNTFKVFEGFNYRLKYKPSKILNRLFKTLDSPFPWIQIFKNP